MLETQVYAYHGPVTLYLAGYDVPHPMHHVISTFITSGLNVTLQWKQFESRKHYKIK